MYTGWPGVGGSLASGAEGFVGDGSRPGSGLRSPDGEQTGLVQSAVRLEIDAEVCEYAPDGVMSIVIENVRALKLVSQGFESE